MAVLKDELRQIELPVGFTTRPTSMEDAEMVVAMCNACSKDVMSLEKHTVSNTLAEWSLPKTKLDQNTLLVFAPGGKLAGYAEWWDFIEPFVRKNVWYRVHPDFSDLGIDLYLVGWAEGKARQAIQRAPEGSRVVAQGNSIALDQKMQKAFEKMDYHHNRTFLRMKIDFEKPPVVPQWSTGIQVQSMVRGKDERRIIQAMYDSFSDHWGFVQEPFEAYLERYLHFMNQNANLDPALWFMALDGEQVAGVSLCFNTRDDDPDLGWVGTLGVCRPWRGRGLGLALLQHSFVEMYRRGKRKVGLNVDADNLTGATRLYEKAGMRSDPSRTTLFYEKELRPGVDLSKQYVDS